MKQVNPLIPTKANLAFVARVKRLMPNGIPRYIRIYDNGGETFDRYTVVFTGRYRKVSRDQFVVLGMDDKPFHPQGIGMHDGYDYLIDVPTYSHLGKRIEWEDLPIDCQRCASNTYRSIWRLD